MPAAPLVWDVVSEQYIGGVNRDAYHGFVEDDAVNSLVWQHVNGSYSNAVLVRYSSARPHRTPFVQAQYFSADPTQTEPGIKLCLGLPVYPNGSLNPPATQRRFYLSFYRKLKNGLGSPGADDGSGKLLRAGSPNSPDLPGFAIVTHSQYCTYYSSTAQTISAWIDAGPETTWVRWEMYLDADKHWFDVYKNGHYQQGSWSSVPGNLELRPAGDWRFNLPGRSGYAFAPPLADYPAGDGLQANLFGYDDGHGTSLGQEVDISEIYYDNTQARVEVSDQPDWDDSPAGTAHREVQGRLLSWTDTAVSFRLNQGSFAGAQTVYAYVIDADGHVNAKGYPLVLSSPATAQPTPAPGRPGPVVYPNPASAEIRFYPEDSSPDPVEIGIYNVAGERVAYLKSASPSGQPLLWNVKSVPAGVYFYRMIQGGQKKKSGKVAVTHP